MYMWPHNATLTNGALLTQGVKHACDSFVSFAATSFHFYSQ